MYDNLEKEFQLRRIELFERQQKTLRFLDHNTFITKDRNVRNYLTDRGNRISRKLAIFNRVTIFELELSRERVT